MAVSILAGVPRPIAWSLALLAFAARLAYTLERRRRENESDAALGRRRGCQPPPELTKRWPLGIDRIKQIWDNNSAERLLPFFCAVAEEYEPFITISQYLLVGPRAYHILHPENVRAVLSTNFKDYSFGCRQAVFAPLLGDGIFTQEGQPWRHSRELLRKQFARVKYQNLELSFQEHVNNLVSRMLVDGGIVDLQRLFFSLTLETTTALLFGSSVYSLRKDQDAKNRVFSESFTTAQEGLTKRFRLAPFHSLYNPPAFQKACRNVHEFVEGYIQNEGLVDKAFSKEASIKKRTSWFIEQVASGSENVTHLRDQLLNVLLAGRDTTACCLSWTFQLLGRHPDVTRRLREEITGVIQNSASPTREEIRRMPFLRIQSPLHNPILVRKGELVVYSQYITSRKKAVYGPDASDFRPEWWEMGELADVGWGYFPFSGGLRQCLGEDFSLMEVSYTIVCLLQTFGVIELPEGEGVEPVRVEVKRQERTSL